MYSGTIHRWVFYTHDSEFYSVGMERWGLDLDCDQEVHSQNNTVTHDSHGPLQIKKGLGLLRP